MNAAVSRFTTSESAAFGIEKPKLACGRIPRDCKATDEVENGIVIGIFVAYEVGCCIDLGAR